MFKLLCDRSIDDDDLASQPTLSRFENAIDTGSLLKLRDWLIDQFIAAFDAPSARLTLYGSAHAALAADDDLQYVIGRLRHH